MSNPMNQYFRRIRLEELVGVIERARKDHPRVRRISEFEYGVTCAGKCSRNNQEHIVRFKLGPDGVWALCEDCITKTFDIPHCRHTAAAAALFDFYYNEQKAEAA